ncbi:MAG TPA: alpha/beta hydrolase-fold protein [Candidatus Acidoferrales bacterium]|nr:alpha/beta hydrolase-fold protein [Candidatus Acidoferrales bacterium]
MRRSRLLPAFCAGLVFLGEVACGPASGPRFEISIPQSIAAQPITGRVFVFITNDGSREPRFQAGSWSLRAPFFGKDVDQLQPGQPVTIDASTLGYPPGSLRDIPEGDYHVQALLNVYTRFPRSDGHTIWAHMDQWEGQQFNRSPGNLYSTETSVHLAPAGYDVKLQLTRTIPPVQVPPDTQWVKRIKIQSQLLTKFWGHPIYIGATILLPKGYDSHPAVSYPVLYEQGHFDLSPPLGFSTHPPTAADRQALEDRLGPTTSPVIRDMMKQRLEWGYELYQAWNSANFPRMLVVTFQHPTPYFDDSYAVNSANDGPYGDALMQELIPYLETHFRIIRQPYARVLSGGSTGGWESLALEVYHPDFFGGTWTFYPDPIDFHRWDVIDLYSDENAFYPPGFQWQIPRRPWQRDPDGQVLSTEEEESRMEAVLGSHGRSAQQLDIWQAVYGPVGNDGYPVDVWNKLTGRIDHSVAGYMRDHGYDLDYYIRTNWPKIGPQLAGKLHLYCGDMDSYYLNLAVYLLDDFLSNVKNPPAQASFAYGRPMKPHGWQPMSQADLLRMMADFITKHAPAGQNNSLWKYR